MGFGKYLLGAVGVAGAIVAAPIVLPFAAAGAAAAAAAIGTAAAGAAAALGTAAAAVGSTAAAAGTAAAGAATAVGTAAAGAAAAVGGAATAAGSALASSAVGGALVSGSAALGSAVGSAAGAVGLSSIATAAGTSAGAAAVGTITTASTVAATSTTLGVKKFIEATRILEEAENRYESQKSILDAKELEANASLEDLGKLKLYVCKSFRRFFVSVSKIKNCQFLENSASQENIHISKDELDALDKLAFSAISLINIGPSSLGAGVLAGYAAYGGTLAIGTASTGTAIAGLSGAAASNAALAALGGGSLASGGLGMAGGTVVLTGVVAAPILAVGGIFLAAKGSQKVSEAEDAARKAENAITQMKAGIVLLEKIKTASDSVSDEMRTIFSIYEAMLSNLEETISTKVDYQLFSQEEKKNLEHGVLATKVLRELVSMELLQKNKELQTVNTNAVAAMLKKSAETRSTFA